MLLLVLKIVSLMSAVMSMGVNYDPEHVKNHPGDRTPVTVESILHDLHHIRSKGFTHVRTFHTKFGHINIGPLIQQAGLRASLGIKLDGNAEGDLHAAIEAAHGGYVDNIFVGNENLAHHGTVPENMWSYLHRAKAATKHLPVRVGTVQRNTEFLARHVNGFGDFIGQCEVVGINIHTFFTPGMNADRSFDQIRHNFGESMRRFNLWGKLVLTEFGWPTAHSFHNNHGSAEVSARVLNKVFHWSKSGGNAPRNPYAFQMYDQRYKGHHGKEFEAAFGLCDPWGNEKVRLPFGGSHRQPPQQPTDAPTSPPTDAPKLPTPPPYTPAPTPPYTDAPTITPAPSSDDLDSAEPVILPIIRTGAIASAQPIDIKNSTDKQVAVTKEHTVQSPQSSSSKIVFSSVLSGLVVYIAAIL